MIRPTRTALAALAVALLLGACSGSDDAPTTTRSGTTGDDRASDVGRVVALGEEFLLADLLAIGVVPVASTATTADAGFQGLDGYDTGDITALPSDEPNIERLASLEPDTIVVADFVLDVIDRSVLEELAEVVVVPTDGGVEQVEILGEAFDRTEQAAEVVAEVEAADAEAEGAAPDGCEVSLATVYPGPSPAAWVASPNDVAVAVEHLGCTLVPSVDDGEPDGAGRIRLSLEQVSLLDAPIMILLQSDSVEGERESLESLASDALWQQLPAVEAHEVHELDRLGYPGVEGRVRLYDDLLEVVAP